MVVLPQQAQVTTKELPKAGPKLLPVGTRGLGFDACVQSLNSFGKRALKEITVMPSAHSATSS